MQLINRVLGRLKKVSAKQLATAGVFVLALAVAGGLGLITKQHSAAYNRDCSANAIDNRPNNGGCGADTAQEFIADLRQNQPSDLQALAANFQAGFNLKSSQYDDFAAHAVEGVAMKDGRVIVNNQTVMTGLWSIGRSSKSYSWSLTVPGAGTYHASKSTDVFLSNSIPVLVWFGNDGSVQFVVEKPCGNLIAGEKIVPKFGCNALNKEAVAGKKDTYKFGVNGFANNNAVVTKVVYDFGDGNTAETNSLTATVEHTYSKPGNYTATVRISVGLPGGKSAMTEVGNCKTTITIEQPFFACTGLTAATLDNKKQQFRFTTKMNYGNGATPKSAAFNADGNVTTDVTAKDAQGNFFKEYTFTDTKEHTVSAKIIFTVNGKDVVTTEKCEAKVTSQKTPMCTVPGKENFPPNAPECQAECKPGIPVGSPECNPAELPKTGMGNVAGLFAGTSAFGAAVHGALAVRRNRKAREAAIRENVDVSKYL